MSALFLSFLDGPPPTFWRDVFAVLLIMSGAGLVLWSLWRGIKATRQQRQDPAKALALVRGFRVGIVGVCLIGWSVAWWWQVNWLLPLFIIIGIEEFCESSFYIAALKRTPAT